MNGIRMKQKGATCLLLAATVFALFCGCTAGSGAAVPADTAVPADQAPAAETAAPTPGRATAAPTASQTKTIAYGAWIPYWDYPDAIGEIDLADGSLETVVAFAAVFDGGGNPFLLDQMTQCQDCLNILYSESHTVYLSVVNDMEVEDGVFDGKSVPLLRTLLATDESIDRHIEALMRLLYDSGAKGLEIDYEGIKKDVLLWARYTRFLEKLYQRTSAEGYALRAVLSWDSARYASFPEGPTYSVMCYNLYGLHSGPGPKADRAFLQETFDICSRLPGRVAMAFATGGFDWYQDGTIQALTQTRAEERIASAAVPKDELLRDPESGALHCTFTADGQTHELWYADGTTLAYWRSLALEAGYDSFDLFRLGGNDLDQLTAFWKHNRTGME